MDVLNKGSIGRRILKRLVSFIIVIWGVVTLSFCLQVFTGTDPAEMIVRKNGSVKNVGVEDTPRISEPLSFFEKTLFSSAPTGVSHR